MVEFYQCLLIFRYLDGTSPESLKPDIRLHGPFYSLCQAAFYIFIFRNKPLVEMEGGEVCVCEWTVPVDLTNDRPLVI